MRLIKIYLGIIIILLVVGLGCGVYVWYMIQSLAEEAESASIQTGEGRVFQNTSDTRPEDLNVTSVLETGATPEVQ